MQKGKKRRAGEGGINTSSEPSRAKLGAGAEAGRQSEWRAPESHHVGDGAHGVAGVTNQTRRGRRISLR